MTNISDAIFNVGEAQTDRIKSVCKSKKIDTRRALQRYAGEEVVRGFSNHVKLPFLITGGLIHSQLERETGDVDILFVRQPDIYEIVRSFEKMRPDLLRKGLVIEKYDEKPETLWVDGNLGQRYHMVLSSGATRINLKLDITGGSRMIPRLKQTRRAGSIFFKGQEPLEGFYQSLEAHAADKIDAIMSRTDGTRWKDWSDVAMAWNKRLDPRIIAAELVHNLSRKHPSADAIMSAMPHDPVQFSTEFASSKADDWARWEDRNRRTCTDFIGILCDSGKLYQSVRQEIINGLAAERKKKHELRARQPRKPETGTQNRLPEDFRSKTMGLRWSPADNKRVVNLDDYRDPEDVIGYRPKI